MRNLKRALSLAVASVMLLGMMVVGSSAAGIDDFTDASDIVNQDAVAVTAEIGVFDGYEDGSFGPENVVTRAEMAVIICTMLYGAGVNVNQFAETSVFTDVPAWAEGYVNLCSSLGIVAGVGDGKFAPDDTVTTAQAVLMLCRTLGYFQSATDFGSDWMLAATAKGTELGMYGDLDLTAAAGLTRDDVAELVFNALAKAVTVEYNDTFNSYFNTGSSSAHGVTFDYRQTLGYKNFDLVYMTGADDFGRPSTVWGTGSLDNADLDDDGNIVKDYDGIADNDIIVSLANDADYTYTAKVTPDALYSDVGRTAAQDYDWTVYVDGEEYEYNFEGTDLYNDRNEDGDCFLEDAAGEKITGNGVLTQVYMDTDEGKVTVSIINTYVAEVYDVDEDDETITLSDLYNGPASTSDEFETTAYDEDDVVIYTFADDEVQTVALAEFLEGTVTRVVEGSKVSLDGTSYSYSFQMPDGDKLTTSDVDAETVAYLDSYGYVIYLDADAVTKTYAYVVAVGDEYDEFGDGAEYYGATLLLTDGTKLYVYVDPEEDADAPTNYIVSYSENSDGYYTLSKASDESKKGTINGTLIESGTSAMSIFKTDDYYANSSTIFLLYDGDDYTVYTGIKNVPDVTGTENTKAVVYEKSDVARVVYIEYAEVEGDSEVIFIGLDTESGATADSDTGTPHVTYQAIVGGEYTDLMVRCNDDDETNEDSAYNIIKSLEDEIDGFSNEIGVFSKITYDSDGFVTGLTEMNDGEDSTDYYYQVDMGTEAEDDGVVGIGGNTYAYNEDVVVAYYDGDYLTASAIGRIKDDDNDTVYYVLDGKVLVGVCIVEDDSTGYTVSVVDNDDNDLEHMSYVIEDEDGNTAEEKALKNIDRNDDVTVTFTADNGYVFDETGEGYTVSDDGTTCTYKISNIRQGTTVTAPSLKEGEATADTEATLTLNLTEAVVTVDGTSYVNGQTVTVPVDTTLAVVPTETDADKTVATVSVTGEGNTVIQAGTTYYVRALVDGALIVSYDYQSYDLTLNAPSGWKITGAPAQVKTGDQFTVDLEQTTADTQAADKKVESNNSAVTVSGVTTGGVKAVTQTYTESDASGATNGVFDTFENFKAALEAGELFTTTDNANYSEVTSAADYQTGTTYYKVDVAGVDPVVATAEVKVTIGSVTADVSATLSIEA